MAKNNNEVFLKISIDGSTSIGVIRDLEKQLKAAREELKNINLQGKELSAAEAQFKKLSAELEKLKQNGKENSLVGLTTQVKTLESEIKLLTPNTVEFTNKFQELANKRAELEKLNQSLDQSFDFSKAHLEIQKINAELDKLAQAGNNNGLSAMKLQAQLLEKELGLLPPQTKEFEDKLGQLTAKKGEIKTLMDTIKGQGDEKIQVVSQIERLTQDIERLKGSGGGQSLIVLRKELKLLDLELSQLTDGTAAYSQKLQEIANKKDQFKDLQQAIKALNPEERVKAIVNAGAGLIGIFQAGQSALALFETDSEELNNALQKVIATMGILNGIQAVVSSKDSIGIVGRILGYKSLSAEVAKTAATQQVLDGTVQRTNISIGTMSALLKTLGIGLAVGAVAFLASNADRLSVALGGLTKQQKELAKARLESEQSAAEEQQSVKLLIDEYKSGNTTLERRKQIVKELQDQSPAYFGKLNAEKSTVEDLTAAYEKWSKAIFLKAQIDGLSQVISENTKKKMEIQNGDISDQVSWYETLANALLNVGNFSSFAADQVSTGIKNQNDAINDLDDSSKKAQKAIQDLFIQLNSNGGNPEGKPEDKKDKKSTEKDDSIDKAIEREKELIQVEQDFIEQQNKLREQAFENKKLQADRFFQDERAALLEQQKQVNNNPELNVFEKTTQIKLINTQIEKLEKDHTSILSEIEAEYLSNKITNNQVSNSKLLKDITESENRIKTTIQVKIKEVNSDPSLTGEERAKKLKELGDKLAKVEQDSQNLRTKISNQGAQDRAEAENALVQNSNEVAKASNDGLADSIEANNQRIQEANAEIFNATQGLVSGLQELFNALAGVVTEFVQQAADDDKERVDDQLAQRQIELEAQKNAELTTLDTLYNQGIISQSDFNQKRTDAEKKFNQQQEAEKKKAEDKKKEIDRKTGEFKKAFDITNIAIDTSRSVANIQLKVLELTAAAALNPLLAPAIPLAQAMVPVAIGVGAAQIAAVAARKYAKGKAPELGSEVYQFAGGKQAVNRNELLRLVPTLEFPKLLPGIVKKGTTDTADDVPAMISKDETLINAKSSRKFKPLLSAINSYNDWGVSFYAQGKAPLSSTIFNNSTGGITIDGNSDRTNELLEQLLEQNQNRKTPEIIVKPIIATDEITAHQKAESDRDSLSTWANN